MLDGRLDPDLMRLLAPEADGTGPLPRWIHRLLQAWGRR